MKVGTDGVLLGAWVDLSDVNTVLDIGTGTGLISLMIAQRKPTAEIMAIDIDIPSCLQVKENVAQSSWKKHIKVENVSFQDFSAASDKKYDLIVTNPPFFINSSKAPVKARSIARHTDTLSHDDILKGCCNILKKTGKLSLILPFEGYDCFVAKANEYGFFEERRMIVYPVPNKMPVRILSQWILNKPDKIKIEELIIEKYGRHNYSEEYIELTQDFYLYM